MFLPTKASIGGLMLLLLARVAEASNASAAVIEAASSKMDCVSGLKHFDPHKHKTIYRVGVHAIRGFDAARQEYNTIFGEYLTATAGRRFTQPIQFEMVPVTFQGLFDAVEQEEIDFFYSNPGIYSCIGVEVGAQPLATIIARLDVRGTVYDLDVFGGVIATHKSNRDINTIHDLKGKIIAAGSISMILAGQVQFYEMEKAGMSYVMDPAQVVFTGNQFDVVKGILSGDFDVGFVRTDQIERTKDDKGEFVDPDEFKIISPKIYVMDDGNLFPFLHSTDIYPEWPVASLNHVPSDVAFEVQQALYASGEHAKIGQAYEECKANEDALTCDQLDPLELYPNARCDSSQELAEMAWEASKVGKFAGFRTSRSYFEPRTMHEAAGFMTKDENGDWKCTRSTTLYDGIKCPEGHVKRSLGEFQDGCEKVGLHCDAGFDCFCRPCVFEVDLYEVDSDTDFHLDSNGFGAYPGGCQQMETCGTVEQTKNITFRAYDNMERASPHVRVVVQKGLNAHDLPVSRIPSTFAYEFSFNEEEVGDLTIEVYFDSLHIPASPVVVEVIERTCDGDDRVANTEGRCVCDDGALEMGGSCVSSTAVFVSVSVLILIVAMSAGLWYLGYKRKESDQLWHISEEELQFDNPPEVIGQGGFGVVLLADYRGTTVAIKRVLPPKKQNRRNGSRDFSVSGSKDKVIEVRNETPSKEPAGKVVTLQDETDLEDPHPSEVGTATGTNKSLEKFLDQMKNRASRRSKWWLPKSEDHGMADTNFLLSTTFNAAKTNPLSALFPCMDAQSRQRQEFVEEMRLLSRLRHPNITTIMGAVISPFHEPMLVMEYFEYGSLDDLLSNESFLPSGEIILQIVRDVSSGIRFLHANKPPIMHCDLKAKNILVDSRFRAKVGDFGLSSKKTLGLAGTAFWLAPEYLKGGDYTPSCDMYSFGVILYEIYARKSPYEGQNPIKVLKDVCNARVNKRPGVPETCPPKLASLMKAEPLSGDKAAPTERPTEDMLYKLFPSHIADALKKGQKVEPESHDLVTVFFSDIVKFTDISRSLSPLKVSKLLDRLYLVFDSLSSKHGVFKVETIGDAYMGVTNLNGKQPTDHVKRIADFAIEVVQAANQVQIDEEDPDRGCVKIRVGFHSGPVVSSVIGSLNPRYGLFGDTVNTAARMETNSTNGRIHCSERSAMLLAEQSPETRILKRGVIKVKGKGDMTTYWVLKPLNKEDSIRMEQAPDDSHVDG
ncbi:activated protein kinase catalytic subunit alpha-1 [Seminavis robusta]|uniref:guanylate cyclase n=1 Tax=Seminavis robusta TaxID=568900 RepID=A0A9N8H223_9STRA|nr:activated protein kinase catalytic subunit alpha-1 [Seminavis robusta]|eukprot:Sro11_g008770.1 activated protein kinase catalytic subunit alpha-1 (1227) ;mRNA; r:146322-151990